MGIYDRDYYRDDEQGLHLSGPRSMVTNIVIVNSVLYLAVLLLSTPESPFWLARWLSLQVTSVDEPWMWWQFLTNGFVHDPQRIRHVLFNMLGLWFLGGEVERRLGRAEFLRFYLLAIVVGSVVWGVRNYFQFGPEAQIRLLGASGAVTAVVMLFVYYFPKRTILLMFILPVPAWVLGVIIIVGNLMFPDSIAGSDAKVAWDVHLLGAAFATLYFFGRWNLGRFSPSLPNVKHVFRRRRLKVHRPPESEVDYGQLDAEADRILDKLHREGEGSLTRKERRTLEAYSRRMKQKHR